MIKFPEEKIYNAYIVETFDYESVKREILNFAIKNGFDEKVVNSGNHPDIIFVESFVKEFKINEIRDSILATLGYTPQVANKKFYIIYDSVNLNEFTQDALLKTLEEPPDFDIFFLVTSNANKFLETIKSRCIILKDNKDLDVAEILNIDFFDEAIKILANLKYEKISSIMEFATKFDNEERVSSINETTKQQAIQKSELLNTGTSSTVKNNVIQVPQSKFVELIRIYRYVLRDAMAYKMTLTKDVLVLKTKAEMILEVANAFTFEEIGNLIDNLNKLSVMRGLQVNKKVAIFNFYQLREH